MFVQKLNPLTGEADWVLVNDPGLGDEDDASADLVATSSYLDMLTDKRRNTAYHAALRRIIPAKQRDAAAAAAGAAALALTATTARGNSGSGVGGVRALDIGTGTGLLAMMAARLLVADSGTAAAATTAPTVVGNDAPPSAPVIACEVFPPMQNLARRVIARNGLAEAIRVVNKRSDEIVVQQPAEAAVKQAAGAAAARAARAAAVAGTATAAPDMHGRADVIVTEIFDSELLGEGMIPTMRHAVQHLLKDGGVVIPATSRVYGQLVQCPLMHHMTGLRQESSKAPGGSTAAAADVAAAPTSKGAGAVNGASLSSSTSEAAAAAAADRVLRALTELDATARKAFFRSDDFYEIREMHVDLLYQHGEARRRHRPETHHRSHADGSSSSGSIITKAIPEQQQQREQQPLLQPLSEPFLVFDFDWLRPPLPSGRRTVCEVPVTQAGSAHAILLWWQLGMTPPPPPPPLLQEAPQSSPDDAQMSQMDDSATSPPPPHSPPQPLLLSTAPMWLQGRVEAGGDGGPLQGAEQQWRDHWKQCWVQLADGAVAVRCGEVLRVAFEHDDLNIRSKLTVTTTTEAPSEATETRLSVAAAIAATAEDSSSSGGAAAVSGGDDGDGVKPATLAGVCLSAKDRLAILRAEAEAEELSRQQLMPLLSWLGPLALLQLGDRDRLSKFAAALQAALDESAAAAPTRLPAAAAAVPALVPGGAEVVVVDGSMALGLLAASHPGVTSVTLLKEDNLSAQTWLRAAASHLGISANKIKSIRPETYFKRLRAGAGAAGSSTTSSAEAAAGPGPLVLISEPYFSEFEQLVPWAHLKFWRDYDVIRGSSAGRGGRQVVGFPRAARLVAVAAALPELWRTRCALGDVEGLDLSPANAVLGVVGGPVEAEAVGKNSTDADDDVWGDEGSGDNDAERVGAEGSGSGIRQQLPILPYSVWQAGGGYKEVSARQELLLLDCWGHLNDVEGSATLTVTHDSVCHAIVLWLEYDLGSGATAAAGKHGTAGKGRLVVSTAPAEDGGPTATVQGVYLLRQPVEVTHGSRLHVTAQFDGLDADVSLDLTVLPPLT